VDRIEEIIGELRESNELPRRMPHHGAQMPLVALDALTEIERRGDDAESQQRRAHAALHQIATISNTR
jgi:hypothetical protein